MDDLRKKINSQPDLVNCDFVDCVQYGEILDCYFNYEDCDIYVREQLRKQFDRDWLKPKGL